MSADVGDETPDEILMAAYQAGNEGAFSQLFERHSPSVYGFLVRRVGDSALAEDLYQEVFLRVHRGRHTYDARRPFRAWLFGIAHNLLTDALRRRGRTTETTSLEQLVDDGGGRASRIAASGPSPEGLVAARQAARTLERALDSLAPDEKTVLLLARLEGMSYADVGSVLGRSVDATKQLAYRALKRVRAVMRREEEP